jgi:hypothetical protein
MSRARPVEGPTISLFPFLAVLLCTMGALLVLLVLFSRSAKESERAEADAARQRQEEDLRLAKEELAWRLRQLQEIRNRTQDDLARGRMHLAGVEDDARKLADELEGLERTSIALAADTKPAAADEAAIAELERSLKNARESLDKAKEELASKPPAYAVVPYEGVNGTHRRPLYIECCIDGVFLQPEGIRLGPADFEGPPGPGNPLASALRAAREHIARGPRESGDPAAQPYPLLLVRPSGVMAYYAARESIQSWGSEFGYQFIDEDWTLNFPPRDPALAEAEMRAVEESRRRIAWLGEVRRAKPARPVQQYRAATTRGGVVAEGGPSVLGDQSRWDWTEDQAAGDHNGGGQPAGGGPGRGFVPGGAGGTQDGGIAGGDAPGGDVILGRSGAAGGGSGGGTGAGGRGAGAAGGSGGSAGDTQWAEAGGGSGSGGQTGGNGGLGDRYSGPSKFYSGESGDATGDGSSASGGRYAGAGGTAPTGLAGRSAGADAAEGTAGGSAGGTAGGGSAGQQAGAGGGGGGLGPAMPGLAQAGSSGSAMAGSGGGSSGGGSASASLAGKRGSNWASLATHDRPIPLRRPIRLECAASEFRILDDGGRVETRIPIGAETADSIDLLVTGVHAKVGRWGIAGDRMYWKPELVLSETADGRGRREDLERLLADSGLETRRSETSSDIRLLPPVTRTGAAAARR